MTERRTYCYKIKIIKWINTDCPEGKKDSISPTYNTSSIHRICWYRRVGGTFVSIQPTEPTILLDHINNQHQRMNFNIESEQARQILFLDVNVSKTDTGLFTSVYRKHAYANKYVHYFSSLPPQVKTGIISTPCWRAKSTVGPETELQMQSQNTAGNNLSCSGIFEQQMWTDVGQGRYFSVTTDVLDTGRMVPPVIA